MEQNQISFYIITNNSDNYGKKHMKIISNSDDDLPLKKTLEL